MGDVTGHFSRHEFGLPEAKAREYGCEAAEYPAEWVEARLLPLCRVLEVLRARLGGPLIKVISGFRPKAYDLKRIAAGHTGVSPNSQHHDGRAADVQVEGIPPMRVREVTLELYHTGQIEIGGLGLYEDFIHIDIRPGPLKTWPPESR